MKLLCAFFTIFCITSGIVGDLPSVVPRCRRTHPNMAHCIVNAIDRLRPSLASGNFGYGFITKPLEPFTIENLQYGTEAGLKVRLVDSKIYGGSNFKIEKLRVDFYKLKFDALVSLPTFEIYSKYWMDLNVLGVLYKSNGDYYAKHENGKLLLPIRGRRIKKGSKEVIQVDPIPIKYDRGTVKTLKISNLFGGNKRLENIVHTLLTNNPDYIYKNLVPHIEVEISKLFTEVINKIFAQTSFDEMFPL